MDWVVIVFSLCLTLSGCASTGGPANSVSWEEAVEMVKTGDVETVVQYHSRVVTLMMKDGSSIETREPRIDLIFDVIDQCGAPCEHISKITE